MESGIQLGHGMRGYSTDLLRSWGHGHVVIGPRNFSPKKASPEGNLIQYARSMERLRAKCYIDPQLFSTHSSHKNLEGFSYCKACGNSLRRNYAEAIDELLDLNLKAHTSAFILPSYTTDAIDAAWLDFQASSIRHAASLPYENDLFATVALGAQALREERTVPSVIGAIDSWPVQGVYIVCEHPGGEYLTNDTLWLYNLMLLVAEAKFVGKKVYVGYASHQQLSLVLAKCDVLFSGSFLNMRHFATSNFERDENDRVSQRSMWYYAPHLLSEFRLVTLDLAKQVGLLDALEPPRPNSGHSDVLFSADMPSGTAYGERAAFLHYLDSLHRQCAYFSEPATYKETFNLYQKYLQTASQSVEAFRGKGIFDRSRSYIWAFDASESSILTFDNTLGYQMSMLWDTLS